MEVEEKAKKKNQNDGRWIKRTKEEGDLLGERESRRTKENTLGNLQGRGRGGRRGRRERGASGWTG